MTVILDTNVISEAMRGPAADPAVIDWLNALDAPPVTTVINRAEILAGLRLLPPGHRRDALTDVATTVFARIDVCLPLTGECADRYAEIVATRRRAGLPIGGMDALVAAIALEAGATLATRDMWDFDHLGLDLVNPWRDASRRQPASGAAGLSPSPGGEPAGRPGD